MANETLSLSFPEGDRVRMLFGPRNENLKIIERQLKVRLHAKGSEVHIEGQNKEIAKRALEELYNLVSKGYFLLSSDVEYAVRIVQDDGDYSLEDIFLDTVFVAKKKVITPKTPTQKAYIEAIRQNPVVIAIGPAGTGKTYLAMAMALDYFTRKEVSRIILTRPAVEAGEKLGFLPGDIQEKVNPYLRPLYDALYDMLDFDQASRLLERGVIEVAPLAFMRGRTLSDAFIILDEAQNTKPEQMKMFLTRMGFGSKVVITGDITQIDLPEDVPSGLVQIQQILKGIEGIQFVYFSDRDVVRHPIVQEIIKAYERAERRKGGNRAGTSPVEAEEKAGQGLPGEGVGQKAFRAVGSERKGTGGPLGG